MTKHRVVVRRMYFRLLLLGAALALLFGPTALAQEDSERMLTIDRYVTHVSTAPAIAGEPVQLHVREKVLASSAGQAPPHRPVVLMVHGAADGAVVSFDLPFKDYSWMAALAEAGFDAFAMDMTGYDLSTQPPQMNDPCNASPKQQQFLIPSPLQASCPPSYPHYLTSIPAEWDDVGAVVDYLRALRGVDRVSLVGWSLGAARVGGYAALHPEKVDRLVLLAPYYDRQEPTDPPAAMPEPISPMMVLPQRFAGVQLSPAEQACGNGFDQPGFDDAAVAADQIVDPIGAGWGTGVVRFPALGLWGWNAAMAGRVKAPTLFLSGEFDTFVPPVRDLFEDLGAEQKLLVELACASHQAQLQIVPHKLVQDASIDWLLHGSLDGQTSGVVRKGD